MFQGIEQVMYVLKMFKKISKQNLIMSKINLPIEIIKYNKFYSIILNKKNLKIKINQKLL